MNLKSMKLGTNKMLMGDEVVADVGYSNKGLSKEAGPKYPYCLKLYLSEQELSMLGVDKLPVLGSSVEVYAKAIVMATRLENESKTMELQITDMSLEMPSKKKSAEDSLYGESEEGEKEEV